MQFLITVGGDGSHIERFRAIRCFINTTSAMPRSAKCLSREPWPLHSTASMFKGSSMASSAHGLGTGIPMDPMMDQITPTNFSMNQPGTTTRRINASMNIGVIAGSLNSKYSVPQCAKKKSKRLCLCAATHSLTKVCSMLFPPWFPPGIPQDIPGAVFRVCATNSCSEGP